MATEEKLKRMVNNHHGSRVSNGKLCVTDSTHTIYPQWQLSANLKYLHNNLAHSQYSRNLNHCL